MRSPWKPWARAIDLLGLTDSIKYVLLAKAWQFISLPVTLLLIATQLTPESQGFYYTFLSLAGLQAVLELGLHTAIVAFVSHEAARITLGSRGQIEGEARARLRIVEIAQFIFRWYGSAAALLLLAMGFGGGLFFYVATSDFEQWLGPWCIFALVAAAQFLVSPYNYMLEGLGQVTPVARVRLLCTICGAVATWLLLLLGTGLWAVAGMTCSIFLANVLSLLARYPSFFFEALTTKSRGAVVWRTEIWPMQWRLAIQGAVNFLFYSLFNPVLFYFHGSAEAGRFGMALQIVGGIQGVSLAWLHTMIPGFGRLVAVGQVKKFEAAWTASFVRSLLACASGTAAFAVVVAILGSLAPTVATRVPDLTSVLLLSLAYLLLQPVLYMAAYMRAFKEERMTLIGLVSGLSCGCLVWLLARAYGSVGAASAVLLVTAFISFPATAYVWLNVRRHRRADLSYARDSHSG